MNKCSRCGCFFIGQTDVCFNCIPSENNDKAKLTDYYETNVNLTFEDIMYETGIAPGNLSRFLKMPDYKSIAKELKL